MGSPTGAVKGYPLSGFVVVPGKEWHDAPMDVPESLRRWFVVHFVVDLVVAVPLLVAPRFFLGKLGWACVDPASARLVGAALVAIGGQSWIGRGAGVEVYKAL